jgi:molecular chaperone GrpE (heat shock protein)
VGSVAELLQRADVEIIDAPEPYDRRRHAVPGAVPDGARVAGVLSPGFVLDRRVLRRATVRLEDRP